MEVCLDEDDDSRHDESVALGVDAIFRISECRMLHVMLLTTSCTIQWSFGVCIERHKFTLLSCSQTLLFLTSYQSESSLSICNWDTFVDGWLHGSVSQPHI